LSPGERDQGGEDESATQRAEAADGDGGEDDQPNTRVVLEMVGDEGIAHGVEIDEAEGGDECAGEEEDGDEGAAGEAISQEPEGGNEGHCTQGEENQRGSLVEIHLEPARIDEDEGVGPGEFCGVEPERAAGDEAAIEEREVPFGAGCADVGGFEAGGDVSHYGAEGEEGNQPKDVANFYAAVFPVEDQEDGGREGTGDGFAKECGGEEEQRHRVVCAARAIQEIQIGVKGEEIEDEREDIFSLGGPGDGFNLHGVKGEDRGG